MGFLRLHVQRYIQHQFNDNCHLKKPPNTLIHTYRPLIVCADGTEMSSIGIILNSYCSIINYSLYHSRFVHGSAWLLSTHLTWWILELQINCHRIFHGISRSIHWKINCSYWTKDQGKMANDQYFVRIRRTSTQPRIFVWTVQLFPRLLWNSSLQQVFLLWFESKSVGSVWARRDCWHGPTSFIRKYCH